MKKLYCLLLSTTLALIGLTPAHAQKATSQVKPITIQKLVEQSKYYMFDRVRTMCQEWPGCEEWAIKRRKANPSFTIIDAEVEYYVPKANSSDWHYNMYVETMENLQTQTYVFAATENNFPGTAPSKFKKFPGHPFTDMPSDHAKYEGESWPPPPSQYPPKNSKFRKRWPEVLDIVWDLLRMGGFIEQQRVIWDRNGNPRWERRLDIRGDHNRDTAVIAQQEKLGAPFRYTSSSVTTSVLRRASSGPRFSFVTKY